MVSMTSASRYVTSASRYQSRSSSNVRPRYDSTELFDSTKLAKAEPIDFRRHINKLHYTKKIHSRSRYYTIIDYCFYYIISLNKKQQKKNNKILATDYVLDCLEFLFLLDD